MLSSPIGLLQDVVRDIGHAWVVISVVAYGTQHWPHSLNDLIHYGQRLTPETAP